MNYRSKALLCFACLNIFASSCESESSDNNPADAAVVADASGNSGGADGVNNTDATASKDAAAIKDASPDQAADTSATAACTNTQTQGSQCTGDFSCIIGALACQCEQPAWCGGAAPPIDFPTRPKQIVCVAPAPVGCPTVAPVAGTSCNVANLNCAYGTCGFDKAQCKNSKWERIFLAPP